MIKFSHTSMSCYRRCRYRFFLQYVEKLKSPPSLGMLRGSAGHKALAYWYTNQKDDEGALEIAYDVYTKELGAEIPQEEWETTETVLRRYFGFAADDDWKFLAEEQFFDFSVEFEEFRKQSIHFIGYIDGVIDTGNGIYLLENKFLKRVPSKVSMMDAQVSMYLLAAKMLELDVTGVLYNMVRTTTGKTAEKEPFVRKTIFQRDAGGLRYKYQEAVAQAMEIQEWLKNPAQALYRNETENCSWDCSYYQICMSLTDSGSDEGLINDMRYADSPKHSLV